MKTRLGALVVEWRGEMKTLTQWGKDLGIAGGTLRSRWDRGMRGDLLFKQGQVGKEELEMAGLRHVKTPKVMVKLALAAFTQGKVFTGA